MTVSFRIVFDAVVFDAVVFEAAVFDAGSEDFDLLAVLVLVAICFESAAVADLVALAFPVFVEVLVPAFFTFVFLAVFRVATFFVANIHSP